MKKLILVGAGGFGREVFNWARQHPSNEHDWILQGFLGDLKEDNSRLPLPFLGSPEDYRPKSDEIFVCAKANPGGKRRAISSLLQNGAEFISLIHPTVIIGTQVDLAKGVVICPYVVLTTEIKVGSFVTINCSAAIGHDVSIGDWSHINSFVNLAGYSKLGEEVLIGSHGVVLEHVSVGDHSVVGAGSVALRTVKPGKTVLGVPAKLLEAIKSAGD